VVLPAVGSFVSFSAGDLNSAVLGPAAPSARLNRMLLLLTPSADRDQALTLKLASLQNPSSPDYHQWLTATAFADSYATSAADVATVAAWLRSCGFDVAPLPAGRGWIEFSGTVNQVELAFSTQVYSVTTGGQTRAVAAGTIRIPAAFGPLVAGLVSLDGSLSTGALTPPEPMAPSAAGLATQTYLATAPALTPQLAARLLHLESLHATGTVGTGQTIGIAARSNVRSEDIAAFRAAFGLAANPLAVNPNGPDPGRTSDEPAADLLASWAGAAAPGAQVLLAPAATTAATDGLDLSLAALVDQAQASVIAVGYSNCEAALSPAHLAFYAALYRQAAAQGISIVAASGDSGAAACQAAGSDAVVTSGYAVNALAATPWNTAVGVAAFADRGAPEFSAWAPRNPADPAFAGGGGASAVHALPAWQPIPSAGNANGASGSALSQAAGLFSGHRLLPDVALPTAIDAGLNPGLAFCLGGAAGRCTLVRSGGSGAAAALVAGIAALVDQKNGAQGNLSPNLYRLANTSGVFADVAQGDTLLRCENGTSGCNDDGQIGYAAAQGYDLATGLGVVNAQALVSNWAKPQATGPPYAVGMDWTTTTQTISPSATLTLAITISPSSSDSPTPTTNPGATVTFYDNSNQIITVPVSPLGTNQATATTQVSASSGLSLGANVIYALYSGDGTFSSDQSKNITVSVLGSTQTTVMANPADPTTGASITFTATVAPNPAISGAPSPGGTVTFYDGNTLLGTQGLSGNTAALSSIALSTAAVHSITATYSGDGNWAGSTGTLNLTVSKGATATSLTTSNNNPSVDSPITLTASVAPNPSINGTATMGGTVTFFDGGTQLGNPVTPISNVATLSGVVLSTAGTHSITATYSGDTNWAGSTSSASTVTVNKGGTATVVTANTSSPTTGSPITFTATVAPNPAVTGAANLTGSVAFSDGSTQLGTATLNSNVATLPAVALSTAGTHSITAAYGGDNNWATSTSSPLNVSVGKGATTTTLASSATNLTTGTTISFTATVAPTLAGASGAAITGSVAFYDGATLLGSGTLASNVATLNGVTLTASVTHSITAVYSDDTNWAGSTSSALLISVSKGATVTALTATPSVLTAGTASSSVTLTATIAPLTPVTGFTATGTVSFYDGAVLLGTAAVASNAASLPGVLLSNSVDHSLTAVYSGDANWLGSASIALTMLSPLLGDTITLTASPANPTPGQSVILTATVTPLAIPLATAEQYPTGTVTFFAGTTAIGSAVLAPSTAAFELDSSVATLTISTLPGSSDQISAVYNGDLTYKPETSNILTLIIQNFTLTPSASNPGTNLNIVKGGAGSAAYVITGTGGFSGPVQVVCSVPAQDDITCTATPQDVMLPATVTFVVQTFSTGTTPLNKTSALIRPWIPGGQARKVARAVSETALALLGFLLLPFGRRARVFVRSEAAQKTRRFLILLLMLGTFAGLGLGCTTSKTVNSTGTPLQVAIVTITASANIDNTVVSQSAYLTVNVIAPGTLAP
jgi:hypothetical protein